MQTTTKNTRIWKGYRENNQAKVVVWQDDKEVPLDPAFHIRRHSPTGFEWGYGGSGPSQLALAILNSYFRGDAEKAERFYMRFKAEVIANLPHEGTKPFKYWVIREEEIAAWIRDEMQKEASYGVPQTEERT